jgi:hypothetical protein
VAQRILSRKGLCHIEDFVAQRICRAKDAFVQMILSHKGFFHAEDPFAQRILSRKAFCLAKDAVG